MLSCSSPSAAWKSYEAVGLFLLVTQLPCPHGNNSNGSRHKTAHIGNCSLPGGWVNAREDIDAFPDSKHTPAPPPAPSLRLLCSTYIEWHIKLQSGAGLSKISSFTTATVRAPYTLILCVRRQSATEEPGLGSQTHESSLHPICASGLHLNPVKP